MRAGRNVVVVAHRPSLFRRLLARMTGQTLFLVTLTTMFPYFLGFSLLGVDKVFVVQSDGSLEIDFSILGPSLATFFTTAAAIRLACLVLGALWMASWKKRLFQIEYTGGFKMQVLREFLVLVLSATVIVPFVNLLLIMGEVCCSYSGRLLEDRLLGKEQVLLPKA